MTTTGIDAAAAPAARFGPGGAAAPAARSEGAFLRSVIQGIDGWVGAAMAAATAELASASQRQAVATGREHTATVLALLEKGSLGLAAQLSQAIRRELVVPASGAGEAVRGARLELTLIGETQVDEEIETARMVQLIEAEAEAELQQLHALCSGLRGLAHVDGQAAPLRPQLCARGLRNGLAGVALPDGARLFLLRMLGTAVGRQMRRVYAEQAQLLLDWGVEPAAYRVVPMAGAPAAPADDAAPAAAASMQRVVAQARATRAPEPVLDLADAEGPAEQPLRLFGAPVSLLARPMALPRDAAEGLMDKLFEQLEGQIGGAAGPRELLEGLRMTGRQLAAQDPALWDTPDHPWWKLIDRLLVVGSVRQELPPQQQGALEASLQAAMAQIRATPAPAREAVQAAADGVQELATRFLDDSAGALIDQVDALQQTADLDELETELRSQVVQQLRSTPVSAALRQFLVGPWIAAMARVAQAHGPESPQLAAMALVVDDLIRATSRAGQPASRALRSVLLRQASEGLAHAGLPAARQQAELDDLQALLNQPPAPQAESWEEPVDTLPVPHLLDLHAGLPTVPLDMGHEGAPPVPPPEDWALGLQAGAYCRIFLQGRWMTVHLRWVSPTRNLFLFASRHGGRTHSMTRRMLLKLRTAGLATTIEDNVLLAQALESMVHSDVAPLA